MLLNIARSHVNGQFDVWERMRITHGAKEGKAGSGEEPTALFREFIQAGGEGVSKAEVKGASGGAAAPREKGAAPLWCCSRDKGSPRGAQGSSAPGALGAVRWGPGVGSCTRRSSCAYSAILRGKIVADAFNTQQG